MVYSMAERIEIIYIYGSENRCAWRTANVFNERNPGKNVSHTYVRQLISKFEDTGSVANKKRVQRRVLDEATQIEVLGQFAINPTMSLRQGSAITGLSHESVRQALKLNHFHPYKMQILQELREDDPDRRIEFCEEMTQKLHDTPDLLKNICFSDECTFFLNGAVNKHNCRYWSDENPHLFREGHTQYPQKINVWAGILGDKIIGPLFINGNLNGNTYLEMFDTIQPLIVEQIENQLDINGGRNLNEELIHFQHDGAPPHYVLPVRQYLNDNFPEQWIGRRGPIEWPPRSPDLTPLDFFLWGHLKTVVFKTQPTSLDDLRQRIIAECASISREVFQNVRNEFENRLYFCLAQNGVHFGHLIE